MSGWPTRWLLWLPDTTDWGVDTACSCKCHCLYLWFLSVARVCSGFVMITRASGLGMRVGRFASLLRWVGVIAMPDARLGTTLRFDCVSEVPLNSGVIRLAIPRVEVWAFIDHCCVADGVEVMGWVRSGRRELFSADEALEFSVCIVETMELPPWEESLSPAGTEMPLLEGGSGKFPEVTRVGWFWW